MMTFSMAGRTRWWINSDDGLQPEQIATKAPRHKKTE